MKTKEELNALKEEVEAVSKKLHELTEEELAQVSGGSKFDHNIRGGIGSRTPCGISPILISRGKCLGVDSCPVPDSDCHLR